MPYDEGLAQRIREALQDSPNLVEKKMFGGIAFMLNGNMSVGVIHDNLIVRLGAERQTESLAQPHARPFDFTGRPMNNWVMVDPAGFEQDSDLNAWIQLGVDYAASLPPK